MNLIPHSSIIISPDRQRQEKPHDYIASLAESIEKVGLLNALVVERVGDLYHLRAGECRHKALALAWAEGSTIVHGDYPLVKGSVPCLLYGELTPLQRFEIELDENEKRRPLTWDERARAYAELHRLLEEQKPAANRTEGVRAVVAKMEKVAAGEVKRGLSEAHQTILLGEALKTNPNLAKAKNQKEALKILIREKRASEDLTAPAVEVTHCYLGDAIETIKIFPSNHFSAIVCDPPYGIGISQMSYQNSSEQEYDDTYETWKPLLTSLFFHLPRLLLPSAHGYLFCAFERFSELSSMATGAGFEVYPKPLIWDRSPDGRLTTPEKWPRRCYECILYFRRGDRPLYEVRGDVLHYPADTSPDNYHGAKKPLALLRDLLERSTRPGERILDPFAGSFSVSRAGGPLHREVWAVEGNPRYHALGLRLIQQQIKGEVNEF